MPRSALALTAALALWALPGLAAAQTIIIDNTSGAPGFTLTGNDWTTWGTLNYGYDGADTDYHYLSHTVGGSDRVGTASWTPDIPTAGTWQISTWFRMTENRTNDADHFIYDGNGGQTHIVLNQQGEGASGWVDLGSYYCDVGFGGCSVVLDGTDDNQSDEANAVRFVFVSGTGDDDDDDGAGPCGDGPPEPGSWTQESYAGTALGSDWSSVLAATGAPDGTEAHTPNVDAGEFLSAGGFGLCDPDGEEEIDSVEIEVLARTQYASGQYQLNLQLHAGGAASSVFTGTALQWHTLDVTSDLSAWTWTDANDLLATIELDSQPGGYRDSDAWVDAVRVRVTYTVPEPELPPGDDDDDDDSTEPADDDEGFGATATGTATAPHEDTTHDPTDDHDSAEDDEQVDEPVQFDPADGAELPTAGCSCAQELDDGVAFALIGLLMLPLRRRRAHRSSDLSRRQPRRRAAQR